MASVLVSAAGCANSGFGRQPTPAPRGSPVRRPMTRLTLSVTADALSKGLAGLFAAPYNYHLRKTGESMRLLIIAILLYGFGGHASALDIALEKKHIREVNAAISAALAAKDVSELQVNGFVSPWAQQNVLKSLAKGAVGPLDGFTITNVEERDGKVIQKVVRPGAQNTELDLVYLRAGDKLIFNDINVIWYDGLYVEIHISQFDKNQWLINPLVALRNGRFNVMELLNTAAAILAMF